MPLKDNASYMNAFQYEVVGCLTCKVSSVISYLVSNKVGHFGSSIIHLS